MKTVIVGGVAAGASTGARLRRLDESAELAVPRRRHPGPGEPAAADAGEPRQALALDVRTGQDVIRIDRDAKEVEVHDLAQGRTYRESYDKLVLCLGAEPVRPGPPP